jgi:hypothetical protein
MIKVSSLKHKFNIFQIIPLINILRNIFYFYKIFQHEGLNFQQWFAMLLNNDTVGNKGKNTRLALIRRQNARLIERLIARIKRITDDPVIEESYNATQ